MRILRKIFPALLVLPLLFTGGCEDYAEASEINRLFKQNDLYITMKIDTGYDYTMETISESGADDYGLKISVANAFSLRGEAPIEPGHEYRLSFTMENIDAGPVIGYSFWKKPVTSLRHYTFHGQNGNPPSSGTQEQYGWRTFEETFKTQEGEDSFQLTLLSGEGTFYLGEISIERMQ